MDYKIPFNVFDFFSYLIAGFLFEVFFFFAMGLGSRDILPFDAYLMSAIIVIFAYILGHIIALFSSFIVEGIITKKFFRYPSENFFDDPKTNKRAYEKSLQKALIKIYEDKTGFKFSHYNFFKFAFHYVKESSPVTFSRLSTFSALYEFSRNLCMLFLIMAVWSFVNFFSIGWPFYLILIFILLSLIFYLRFLKFFYLFADEVFRSFYVTSVKNKEQL